MHIYLKCKGFFYCAVYIVLELILQIYLVDSGKECGNENGMKGLVPSPVPM